MDNKLIDLVKKIEYFNDFDLSKDYINSLTESSFKIFYKGDIYQLELSESKASIDLAHENCLDKLCDIGLKPREIKSRGIIEELSVSYSIYNYHDFISLSEFIKTKTDEDLYNLGYNFAKILKRLHNLDVNKDINWYNIFLTKANYLFYMHGVSEEIGDKDYIFIDYINTNKHLTKNIDTSHICYNFSPDDILVDKNLNIDMDGITFNIYGDPIFDFVNINRIAIYSKDFARGVLNSYFDEQKPPVKFYRLLALYQAYVILFNIVAKRRSEIMNLSEYEINELISMYDNFNQNIPDWV